MNNLQFTMYNDLQKNRLYRCICTIVNCTLYIVNWFDKLLFAKKLPIRSVGTEPYGGENYVWGYTIVFWCAIMKNILEGVVTNPVLLREQKHS